MWVILGLAVGCPATPPPPAIDGPPANVLVILTDDIGTDLTGTYGGRVPTPTIDGLAEQGVRFTNAYANPTCSPSRVSLLTGRQPAQTGVGRWLAMHGSRVGLRQSEETLPEMLQTARADYSSAALGKWHVNTALESDVLTSPLERGGFDTFAGVLGNPREASVPFEDGDELRTYTHWEKVVDGEAQWTRDYLTTDTIDEAIAAMDSLPEPWFVYVATSAAHEPWHVPPLELHGDDTLTADDPRPRLMDAMVTALDNELARLLESMSADQRERTLIVYATDNGTTHWVVEDPYDPARSKGTTYDGGVRVPMVVSGPGVTDPGRDSDALVHFVDVFPTVAEVVGASIDAPSLDGQSFLPVLMDPQVESVRDWVYTEGFAENGSFVDRMVRNDTHKYRWRSDEGDITEQLFRYEAGAQDEGESLLDGTLSAEDEAALDALMAQMADITD